MYAGGFGIAEVALEFVGRVRARARHTVNVDLGWGISDCLPVKRLE